MEISAVAVAAAARRRPERGRVERESRGGSAARRGLENKFGSFSPSEYFCAEFTGNFNGNSSFHYCSCLLCLSRSERNFAEIRNYVWHLKS
jgi:hypothetical protein